MIYNIVILLENFNRNIEFFEEFFFTIITINVQIDVLQPIDNVPSEHKNYLLHVVIYPA